MKTKEQIIEALETDRDSLKSWEFVFSQNENHERAKDMINQYKVAINVLGWVLGL